MDQSFTYKEFNIGNQDLRQTVDDFMDSIVPITTPDNGCRQIDAARVAAARASACTMLITLTNNSKQQLQNLKRLQDIGFGSGFAALFAPNRIQRKHLTTDSRIRTLMHGGILGVLARQLTRDPTQQQSRQPQWHQSRDALCVVQRANNAAGCAHVKWSIPEFQCMFNLGIKLYKTGQNPFHGLNETDALAQFNALDTADNRNAFLAECHAIAHDANKSRVVIELNPNDNNNDNAVAWKVRRPMVVENTWITDYMGVFAKVCSMKMGTVSTGAKLVRCRNLVDLYRFIARNEWILNHATMRCMMSLDSFHAAHIKRLLFMAHEGIEHSAYMLGRFCPEMMTPDLHVPVVPIADVYMVPQMQIELDDIVFGPMKVACQAFMPVPVAVASRQCDETEPNSGYDGYYGDDDNDVRANVRDNVRG